jgi:soluble lytic murein transglycosylase-like protein
MNWVKCLISSLGLLLLAQAALAADIQRFTDSQGGLHITNMGPRKRQSPVQPPGDEVSYSTSFPQKSPSTPPATEPAPTTTKPPVVPRVAPTAPSSAGPHSRVQVCRSEYTSGMIQTMPGLREEEQPGRAAGALKRVSWTPPQRVQAIPRGGIVSYTDRHKVIHVTNLPQEEVLPEVLVKAAPAVQNQALPATLVPPALQQISWHPPERARPPRRPTLNSNPLPGPAENAIRRYRDNRGVWHITNEPAPEGGPHPALAAITAGGRASPSEALALKVTPVTPISTVKRQILSPYGGPPAAQKLTCSELGPEVATYLEAKLRAASIGLTGQTIHRQRDDRGIWHITNEPALDTAPPLSLVAAAPGGVSPAQAHAPPAIRSVGLPGGSGWARAQSLPQGSTVIARRDRRGVLHVSTLDRLDIMQSRGDSASFLNRVSPFLQAIIAEAAQINGLPATLVMAIIQNESNFAPMAVSPKGAMGLMQLMPMTAASLGVADPFAPRENVMAGCRYFRWLLDSFQGAVPLALAAYNAGQQRVISAGWQVPAIKETQNFVTQVMGLYYVLEKQAAST